ncbi:MAG: hypothetical protein HFJ24_02875 [Clostridia bacterium]|nr:hypothetical protein [Clostridia bacterium]
MENATKAIIMAGGILIAIIIISIFYFVFNQTGDLVGEATTDTQQKELEDFNKSFEAYNKKIMYGTDIISVLNKAIDNNRRYEVEFGEYSNDLEYMDYYIDVEFTVYRRNDSNQKIGKNTKDTYSLSSNYKNKKDIIYTEYIEKAQKGDAGDDIFRSSFKFAGFKCTKVIYQDKASVKPSNIGAVGRVKKMVFEELWEV